MEKKNRMKKKTNRIIKMSEREKEKLKKRMLSKNSMKERKIK